MKTRQYMIEFIKKQKVSFIASVDEEGFPNIKAMFMPRKIEGNCFYFTTIICKTDFRRRSGGCGLFSIPEPERLIHRLCVLCVWLYLYIRFSISFDILQIKSSNVMVSVFAVSLLRIETVPSSTSFWPIMTIYDTRSTNCASLII